MGRWTQYDEDDYRLPEGMKRVGYDADSGTYFFRDRDGTLWEGAEGAQYGELRRVSGSPGTASAPDENSDHDDDLEAAPRRADGYHPLAAGPDQPPPPAYGGTNASAYRMIFPFLLLVAVSLLLVIRLLHWPASPRSPEAAICPDSSDAVSLKAGDTCWDLAQTRGCSLAELMDVNPGLECTSLVPGQSICLPHLASTSLVV